MTLTLIYLELDINNIDRESGQIKQRVRLSKIFFLGKKFSSSRQYQHHLKPQLDRLLV